MGFIPGTTIEIEAFLTENGAQQIMSTGIGIVKYFAISDEASNYVSSDKLTFNQMFTLGGKLTVDGRTLSVISNPTLRNRVFVDNTTETLKTFEGDSGSVVVEQNIGSTTTSNFFNIYSYEVDKTSPTYQLNWISDLAQPYGSSDTTLWGLNFNSGGYSNTAISDMISDYALIFVIDGSQHAYIDGKSIKFTMPFLTGTTDIYGTYINTNNAKSFYDGLNSETSQYLTSRFGSNVVLLFSDLIQRPNADATKSWSTGYNFTNAPFSQGNKNLANYVASPGYNKDIAVGIAYLDKGVIVIFNPVLYTGYVARSTNDINIYNRNLTKRTAVNFICDLPIGKFYRSQNPTYTTNSSIRISSIGLFNSQKELVAVGRLNSEIEKNNAQRLTFLVKLVI